MSLRGGSGADPATVTSVNPFDRARGGAITSTEALVLAVMAAILVAITIPSYVAMRNRSNDSTARAHLRQAEDAAEAYRAERGSYVGMSSAALARFDPELRESAHRLEAAGKDGYCVESTVGGRTWYLTAPTRDLARGSCP